MTELAGQVAKLRQGLARLIDSYAAGLLEKEEFEPRVRRLRERIAHLEEQARRQADEAQLQRELAVVIGRVAAFAERVRAGLAEADWQQRREIIQALVKRIEVEQGQITVVFRIDAPPPPDASSTDTWQDRPRGVDPGALHRDLGAVGRAQPVGQGQQVVGHRAEGAHLLAAPAPFRTEQAGYDRSLVYIQPAAALVQDLHHAPLSAPDDGVCGRGHRECAILGCVLPRRERQAMVPRDAPVKLSCGRVAPDDPRPAVAHTPRTIANAAAIFMCDGRGRPRGQLS